MWGFAGVFRFRAVYVLFGCIAIRAIDFCVLTVLPLLDSASFSDVVALKFGSYISSRQSP